MQPERRDTQIMCDETKNRRLQFEKALHRKNTKRTEQKSNTVPNDELNEDRAANWYVWTDGYFGIE